MEAIQMLWTRFLRVISIINFPADIVDILIVTYLIYKILNFAKSHSTRQIIKAVIILLVLSYVSSIAGLNALNYIVSRTIEVGLIALVVVFQPELRRALERLGGSSLKGIITPKVRPGDTVETIEQTVDACRTMSRQKVGALIVFEREHSLEEYFKTGTVVDAAVSSELLKNIFFPKAALHDGAVVVRSDRVAAAGCVLPLTENANLSRELGTRHRAAIGISECSDAIVVVVSEETGVISCVQGGRLRRYLTPENLTKLLKDGLVEEEILPVHHRLWERLEKRFKAGKGEDQHEDE